MSSHRRLSVSTVLLLPALLSTWALLTIVNGGVAEARGGSASDRKKGPASGPALGLATTPVKAGGKRTGKSGTVTRRRSAGTSTTPVVARTPAKTPVKG